MYLPKITLPILLIGLIGCSMGPSRSYEDQMDRISDGFFRPNEDFPVVAGDSGTIYRSKKEILGRTPKGLRDSNNYKENENLEDELYRLQTSLTERGNRHYSKYQGQLPNISTKIYFLKLRTIRERNRYLSTLHIPTRGKSRGLASVRGGPTNRLSREEMSAIRNRDVISGMSKDAVVKAWGNPELIEVAGNARHENERWAYYKNGRIEHIYFENGYVEGWSR